MKYKSFYFGKYILRDGDMLPEEINESSCRYYNWRSEFLNHLDVKHLIFSTREEAMSVHEKLMDVIDVWNFKKHSYTKRI